MGEPPGEVATYEAVIHDVTRMETSVQALL